MSAEIASCDFGQSQRRSRQKSRLLPAVTQPMSAEIASCDFGQSN
jgi:uncharacterized protein YifN (PemK superfamily)